MTDIAIKGFEIGLICGLNFAFIGLAIRYSIALLNEYGR